MKTKLLLVLCLAIAGCGPATRSSTEPAKPDAPIVVAVSLNEIAVELAARIPKSIDNSDQLILILNDLVTAGDLTQTQADQIKSALANVDSVRALTDTDAAAIRGVK